MAFGRFRRRRRRLSQWFPVLGTETHVPQGTVEDNVAYQDLDFDVSNNVPNTLVVALTWDNKPEQQLGVAGNTTFPSIADWEQSGWQLDSIVGCVPLLAFKSGTQAAGTLFVTAAFEVLRIDPGTGNPLSATPELDYDPQLANNIRDPWIWRRSWILDPGTDTGGTTNFSGWPRTNTLYTGSGANHVFQTKSRRRIGPEERLFFICTARHFPVTSDLTGRETHLTGMLDYRIIGRAVKTTNRRNASR